MPLARLGKYLFVIATTSYVLASIGRTVSANWSGMSNTVGNASIGSNSEVDGAITQVAAGLWLLLPVAVSIAFLIVAFYGMGWLMDKDYSRRCPSCRSIGKSMIVSSENIGYSGSSTTYTNDGQSTTALYKFRKVRNCNSCGHSWEYFRHEGI